MAYNPPELTPSQPFDAVLGEMLELHRRKSADYAKDADPLSNFYRTAEIMREKGWIDFTALTSVDYALAMKQARIENLRAKGKLDDTVNESVRDTMIDDANYAVLRLAVYDRERSR